ncbi:hypothetical protein [Gottfriedia solisilvae]|uniref:Uncharacterized protein n=1 Tax=Gottfriedia solisilvae TaxID=1516104 RepID=A0A8J3AFI5_9BACI|nr:hypothetical protein [Gottfriedia solisilvae]GGI11605.1 hypothetical protein GCM10007380_08680 [Gottfriedia solisilvae]
MFQTFGFSIVFAIIYMLVTLNLGEIADKDTVTQLNFGLIIGTLIWIGIKITNKWDKS